MGSKRSGSALPRRRTAANWWSADARARLVVLSARGRKLCAAAATEVERVEREWRAHLGVKDYAGLRAALMALREITDPFQ